MGYYIVDLTDKESSLSANFWNWRPTAELIRSFGILDEERCEDIQVSGLCTEVTRGEARQIGQRILDDVLTHLSDDERVKLNLATTREPDDLTFHKGENWEENYSATKPWLQEFADFCLKCDGFSIC